MRWWGEKFLPGARIQTVVRLRYLDCGAAESLNTSRTSLRPSPEIRRKWTQKPFYVYGGRLGDTVDMKKGRSGTLTMALCLVGLAFVLSLSSAGVLPLFSFVKLPPSIAQTPGSSPSPPPLQLQTGTLVVKASFFGGDGLGGVVPDASVTVTDVDSGFTQGPLLTNSSGELQILLYAGNYSVRVSTPESNASTNAQVYGNRVTEVDLVTDSVQSQSLSVLNDARSPRLAYSEQRDIRSLTAGTLSIGGILLDSETGAPFHVKIASPTSSGAVYHDSIRAYRGEGA